MNLKQARMDIVNLLQYFRINNNGCYPEALEWTNNLLKAVEKNDYKKVQNLIEGREN